jgi:hypothetical protein
MGKAIASQHPAVVLRSHYNHLRALLAVAMIAVVGLSAAVVILATDDDPVVTSAGSATQASAPSPTGTTRYDGGPEEGTRGPLSAPQSPSTRFDGGPEEGTADVSPSQPRVTQSQAFPGLAREANAAQADERRFDGGPEEGTGALVRPSAPATFDSNSIKEAPGVRYDGGPEEGTRGPLSAPQSPSTRFDGGPEEGTRSPLTSPLSPSTRSDGGPEEGTRGAGH